MTLSDQEARDARRALCDVLNAVAMARVAICVEPYTEATRTWLDRSDHYLKNASPGGFYCVTVRPLRCGLFGPVTDETTLLGVAVFGRPVAPGLPQDGTMAEVTRMFLVPGMPYGLASEVLFRGVEAFDARCGYEVIAYHDRTRHTGCIYRKAGFVRWTAPRRSASSKGWGSREGRVSGDLELTPKRRWVYRLRERVAEAA